jgi:hypothetical protein
MGLSVKESQKFHDDGQKIKIGIQNTEWEKEQLRSIYKKGNMWINLQERKYVLYSRVNVLCLECKRRDKILLEWLKILQNDIYK